MIHDKDESLDTKTHLEAVDIVAPYDTLVSGPHSVDLHVAHLEIIKGGESWPDLRSIT